MPLYHVHFSTDASEPLPPLASMQAVEAADPMRAIAEAWKSFTVGDRLTIFARVVTELDAAGNPSEIISVQLNGAVIPVKWSEGKGGLAKAGPTGGDDATKSAITTGVRWRTDGTMFAFAGVDQPSISLCPQIA